MEISAIVGKRIRKIRKEQHLTMEDLSTLSGLNPSYIGQLERGEKNASITTIEKVAAALNIPMSDLFEGIVLLQKPSKNIPAECRSIICSQLPATQEILYSLLNKIVNVESDEEY